MKSSTRTLPSWWPALNTIQPCKAWIIFYRGCSCIREGEDSLTTHSQRCVFDQDTYIHLASECDSGIDEGDEVDEHIDCLKTVTIYATAPGPCPDCQPILINQAANQPKPTLAPEEKRRFQVLGKCHNWLDKIMHPTQPPLEIPNPKATNLPREVVRQRLSEFTMLLREQECNKTQETLKLRKLRAPIIMDAWREHVRSETARDPDCILSIPKTFEDPEDEDFLPPSVPTIDQWVIIHDDKVIKSTNRLLARTRSSCAGNTRV